MHPRFTSLPASFFSSRRRTASRRSVKRSGSLKSRRRALAARSVELLESRRVLATLYVAPSFSITSDVAPAGLSSGDTVTWDAGKPDQQTGLTYGTNAFNDIQTAVNAASSGDTIRVAAGLYQLSAAVNVTTPLTILGPQADVDPRPSAGSARVEGGPDEAVLDGGGTVADTFMIAANNVTINGFDLRDTLDAVIDTNPAAVYSNTQVLDNFVHHALNPSGGKGIRFQGITGGVVKNNDIYDVRDTGVEIGSGAAGSSPGAVVSDNEVHDLGAGGSSNSALYAYAVPFATDLNVTFQGNLIYNFGGNDAIKVGAKNGADRALTGGSVLDNVVHDVVEDGITIDASNTLVKGNEVYNSSSDNAAIYVEHSNGGDTIANNYVHNNTATLAAILIGDLTTAPTGVVVTGNSITSNTHNMLVFRDLNSGNTVDASANWWGSADSAVVAASVISTTPGQIDFTPWLNSGADSSPTTPGFQPDFSALTVAPAAISPQFGATGRINEGIQDVAAGGTVTVLNGVYNEGIDLNTNVVVAVSGTVSGPISGVQGTLAATGPLTLGDGTAGAINTTSALNVGAQTVTLSTSDAAVLGGVALAGGTLTAPNGINLVPTPVVMPILSSTLAVANTGTLSGAGVVNAAVNATGTGAGIAPSDSAGTLTVTSATLDGSATFNVGISGTTPGTGYSQLVASNGVNLNGAALTGTDAFTPTAGQTFEIISNTSANPISGTFAGLPEGAHVALGNAQFTISYAGGDGNDVVLTAVNATPAVTSVSPSRLVEGSPDTTITVNGTGFVNGSTVQFNGQPLTTTFVSGIQLTAVVPAAAISEEGTGSITVVTPGPGGGTSQASSLPIDDAPLTATGTTLSVPEATVLTPAVVATFTDADPNGTVSDYTATIDWGDGSSTTGAVTAGPPPAASPISGAPAGAFYVSGSHAYAEDGAYTIAVKIADAGGATATATSSVTVTEPALTGAAVSITGQERVALGTVPGSANPAAPQAIVATFTHGSNLEATTGFSAQIAWGDGTFSPGTVVAVSPAGTGYQVLGAHTYLDEGNFSVTVTITDESAVPANGVATVHSTATISEEPLPGGIQGTATQRWISEVYRDLLGRAVDPGAFAYWTQQAAAGEKPSQIVLQIEQAGPDHEYYHTQVEALYAKYLHRAADPQGLDNFVSALAGGATLDQVAATIVASPEYYANQGGGTNSGFVTAMFRDVLGRPIASQDLNYFQQQLTHEGRVAIADEVFGSAEYRNVLVTEDFELLLDRPAEAPAQSFYAAQLAHGTSNDAVLAAIAATDEYFAKTA
ncbi:MAG TPA: DUF4214 domain-containing protein [Pirellulales bacterium]|nr:DUF4214 domain-containing protein [Pirellulales bacterium]